ncbi:glycosyltransferase family 4 protein [Sinomonas flava]|uniref:glycosyltransferase family 4 protein n=1 Tax=Sinomonas flava TaxID=496857 RepID=UPI0039A7253F
MMTLIFLETLAKAELSHYLVERRFSRTLDDVGRFSFRKLASAVGLLMRVARCQSRYRPAAWVIFITNRPASFIVDWAIIELLTLLRQPLIHYVHTIGFRDLAAKNRILNLMVRRSLRAADKIVCLGSSLMEDVAWAVSENVSVIPNTPLRTYDAAHSRVRKQNRLLFLSNLLPDKGAGDFVECAIELCRRGSADSFVIAGPAPDEPTRQELIQRIEASGFDDRIELIGPVDEDQKQRLFASATALVFPSKYRFEAQPLTIVEALSAGVPIIAYDTGGIRDLVISGKTGVLVRQGDLRLLREAVERVVEDAEYRNALSAGARRHFSEHFSRQAYDREWNEILADFGAQTSRVLASQASREAARPRSTVDETPEED